MNTIIQSLKAEKDIPGSKMLSQSQLENDPTHGTVTVNSNTHTVDAQDVVQQVKKLLDSGARLIKVVSGNGE